MNQYIDLVATEGALDGLKSYGAPGGGRLDLLAAVLEHADAAIVACDADGKVIVRNAAARQLLGEGPLPDNHPLFRALREGAQCGVEVRITSGSRPGTSMLVSAEPLVDSNQTKIGAVATCAPMSAAFREQHRETEEARKRLELLLESTGEGIYGVDMDGRCTFVNGSAVAMLGCGRQDPLDQRMHDLIHHTRPDGQPYSVETCPIYRAFREGLGCRVDDEMFFRADGSSFRVEYSAYPILDDGVVRGAVVTFSDVSARKRTEAALRASEAKYRTLFETVSERRLSNQFERRAAGRESGIDRDARLLV